ncbi:MAG: hypothetical protein ACRERD_13705, partial [Candidatus Binatia bacterium]
ASDDDDDEDDEREDSMPEDQEPQTWRSLRHLTVCMSLLSTTGKWYFDYRKEPAYFKDTQTRSFLLDINTPAYWPPSEESRLSGASEPVNDPMDRFPTRLNRDENWQRDYPIADTMNPLLLSFARLLESSTALQTAQVVARRGLKAEPWVVAYCAAGSTSRHVDFNRTGIETPRVWLITEDWRPSAQVIEVFRRAGSAAHKQEATVIWWHKPAAPVVI